MRAGGSPLHESIWNNQREYWSSTSTYASQIARTRMPHTDIGGPAIASRGHRSHPWCHLRTVSSSRHWVAKESYQVLIQDWGLIGIGKDRRAPPKRWHIRGPLDARGGVPTVPHAIFLLFYLLWDKRLYKRFSHFGPFLYIFYYCTKEKIYEHRCFAPPVVKDTLYYLIQLSYLIIYI